MIRELSELGKKIRPVVAKGYIVHDSLSMDKIDIIISITKEGKFKNIYPVERETIIEDVVRTEDKGRTSGIVPRLLIDKAQYVLAFPENNKRSQECHKEYLNKLKDYSITELDPVLAFYKYKNEGVGAAYNKFEDLLNKKEIKDGNIGFLIFGEDNLLNENNNVLNAIKERYINAEIQRKGNNSNKCSICGREEYRTNNISTHGVIKRVPDGQTSGCTLVTYNADAFESYNLNGNDNASICTNCIKNYVESLNWLLANGSEVPQQDKKSKEKTKFKYSNRKKLGNDTAIVFWTKENRHVEEIDFLDEPDEGAVANLIESVANAKISSSKMVEPDQFYAFTLSGAAARIAVRDWIQLSLSDLKKTIAAWFRDIAIERYDWDEKQTKQYYPPLYFLSGSCQRKISNNKKDDKDVTPSRVSTILWSTALKGSSIPVWVLSSVLKRVRVDEEGISPERASLIKLILNRNNKGGLMLKEGLDLNNTNIAYICGRIFAVMESIQRAALGKNINAGIRERYFSFASTNPSPAFGRLCKMSQNHLTKLKNEKPGLYYVLDKELQEQFSRVNDFPVTFNLEDQGRFAIGYYHQKQSIFTKAKDKPELLETVEESNLEK